MRNTKDPGVNYVPPWLLLGCVGLDSPPPPPGHLHHHQDHYMQPLQPITLSPHPSSFKSPTSLIPPPFFFLIYPSHSLSHPRYSPILSFSTLACFTSHLHQPSLNIPLPTIIKHLTLGSTAPPLQPPRLSPSLLRSLVMCARPQGRGAPVTPRPSRWPPLCGDLCV